MKETVSGEAGRGLETVLFTISVPVTCTWKQTREAVYLSSISRAPSVISPQSSFLFDQQVMHASSQKQQIDGTACVENGGISVQLPYFLKFAKFISFGFTVTHSHASSMTYDGKSVVLLMSSIKTRSVYLFVDLEMLSLS